MKKIIFDIETKTALYDPETPELLDMEISVLSLWDSESNKYYSFLEKDFEQMWPFFEKADLLITFNGNYFDIPLLQKYAPFDLKKIPHLDLFTEIFNSLGRKIGLDAVASATLGTSKSANGLQAVAWWNSGEVDKIIKYCEQDVLVTKEVYDYARANKKLFYIDRKSGKKEEISLQTENWEKNEAENSDGETLSLF